jgi:hypothetical protein
MATGFDAWRGFGVLLVLKLVLTLAVLAAILFVW